ncbi:SRPBCC family protein [Algibacter mikhailovii]|uniref:Cell division protein n=1 Tax=Algibacter mikhailovii TaxID=425498 RepID=A0A918RAT6_9FLAO|nr:SRPBCC family protein [Algibacter mikhailovii]GGZ90565.1 hypothetical protein GCM10007028_31110 [Algibacter mikhailovii]
MPQLEVKTVIHSDLKTCFDLSRNIDFRKETLMHKGEMPIDGITSGYLHKGDWVSWEAIHFGFVQHITSKITDYNRPCYLLDEMVSGPLKSYRYEHVFKEEGPVTVMTCKFYFESPYGIIGKLANVLILKKYIKRLLLTRAEDLKKYAEKKTANKLKEKRKWAKKPIFQEL